MVRRLVFVHVAVLLLSGSAPVVGARNVDRGVSDPGESAGSVLLTGSRETWKRVPRY